MLSVNDTREVNARIQETGVTWFSFEIRPNPLGLPPENPVPLGQLGDGTLPLTFNTFGSNTDTEIALYGPNGDLLIENDDLLLILLELPPPFLLHPHLLLCAQLLNTRVDALERGTILLMHDLPFKHQPLLFHPDAGDPNLSKDRVYLDSLKLVPHCPVSQNSLQTGTNGI